jgi:DHA1 family tetracycline resistance protein-like MFS transporter
MWLHPSRFTPVLKNSVVFQLLLISFVSMAAFVMMEATAGLYLAKLFGWQDPKIAARKTGWFFGYVGLVIVIVQGGLIGRLTKKRGEWPLAIAGAVFVALGMAGYVAAAHVTAVVVTLAIAGALNAIGRSLQGPTLSSLLSKFSDPREQGVVFGMYHGLSSLARVIGPILAGLTYPLWKNTGPFVTSGAIVLVAGAWTVALRGQARGRESAGMEAGEAVGRAATTEVE